MTMADYVVVLRDGVIEQQGKPLDLYDAPANKFVAGFIGSPAMNFIPAVVGEDGQTLELELGAGQTVKLDRRLDAGRSVIAGLRPEHLALAGGDGASIRVKVSVVESTGSTMYLSTDTEPELTVVVTGRSHTVAGDEIGLSIAPENVHVFDAASEARI
jgi:multiple sugar transport system ATP-binding protein